MCWFADGTRCFVCADQYGMMFYSMILFLTLTFFFSVVLAYDLLAK